mmetsp:Transcript_14271/g.36822  ORF Transcript_14271/g.36822 Transcript_14271/m.36822 type:complete len:223 (+) Transcript_14271:2159-2827(+)
MVPMCPTPHARKSSPTTKRRCLGLLVHHTATSVPRRHSLATGRFSRASLSSEPYPPPPLATDLFCHGGSTTIRSKGSPRVRSPARAATTSEHTKRACGGSTTVPTPATSKAQPRLGSAAPTTRLMMSVPWSTGRGSLPRSSSRRVSGAANGWRRASVHAAAKLNDELRGKPPPASVGATENGRMVVLVLAAAATGAGGGVPRPTSPLRAALISAAMTPRRRS